MPLTLAQMLKGIAFCAVGLAVPALLRSADGTGRSPWPRVAALSLVIIPTLWALMALLVLRSGRGRDRLFWGLLLVPVSSILAGMTILAGLAVREALTSPAASLGDVLGSLIPLALMLVPWGTGVVQLRRALAAETPRPPADPALGPTPER